MESVKHEKEVALSQLQSHLQLEQLKSLVNSGVIDNEEFERMKSLTVRTTGYFAGELRFLSKQHFELQYIQHSRVKFYRQHLLVSTK